MTACECSQGAEHVRKALDMHWFSEEATESLQKGSGPQKDVEMALQYLEKGKDCTVLQVGQR